MRSRWTGSCTAGSPRRSATRLRRRRKRRSWRRTPPGKTWRPREVPSERGARGGDGAGAGRAGGALGGDGEGAAVPAEGERGDQPGHRHPGAARPVAWRGREGGPGDRRLPREDAVRPGGGAGQGEGVRQEAV